MNLQLIKQGMVKMALPAVNTIKQNSPKIFIGLGAATGIGCVVAACKGTLKVDEVIDYVAEKKEKMNERCEDVHDEYDEDDKKKDMVTLYVQSGVKLAKLYAPAVALGIVSFGCFLGANRILTKRNAALLGMVSSLEQTFASYRARVVEEFGEEKDFMFNNGIYEESVKVEYVDENGKKKKRTEKQQTLKEGELGIYTRIYGDGNRGWSKNPELNMMTLKAAERFANQRLHAFGYVFLSEIFEDLGFPETEMSRNCGWLAEGTGDGYVDFGIFELTHMSDAARNFINGEEATVLLNFNCDGYISNQLPKTAKPNIWMHKR